MRRRRLDVELVRRGLAASQVDAREAILAGRVAVGGAPANKPGSLVSPEQSVRVDPEPRPYVSRGGEKLAAALDRFGIDVLGRQCLDAGASTGGFTDVLVRRGAAHVVSVDVGYGELAWRLRRDPRVTVMERTNARTLRPEALSYPPDLVVADLSFTSLVAVVPAIVRVAADGADLVLLVKPQFEAAREEVGPGGVVRDRGAWRRSLGRVAGACREHGAGPVGATPSPLPGPAGNVEFFLHARVGHPGRGLDLDAVVAEGAAVREAS